MSDYKPIIYSTFINRRDGTETTTVPILNRVSINKDIRQLCDSFDFDISYRLSETIDLRSHDFVEFYFLIDDRTAALYNKGVTKFQIACGFVEDFMKETDSTGHRFQGTGRDFLGQLFNVPFLKAKAFDSTTLSAFVKYIINSNFPVGGAEQHLYLAEYLNFRNIARQVVNKGAYTGPVVIPELTDSKIAPILQQIVDEIYNVVYQNRHGQVVIWGRDFLADMDTGLTLRDYQDSNVQRFVVRENYSKVFSEVQVQYTGGANNVDYNIKDTVSQRQFNSDSRARQIFQPEIRTFQTSTLITTSGTVDLQDKTRAFAKSILRKSNQNLSMPVITTNYPYFVQADGSKIPYEINQVFTLESTRYSIREKYRLAGIGYSQDDQSLTCQLMFVLYDSLI